MINEEQEVMAQESLEKRTWWLEKFRLRQAVPAPLIPQPAQAQAHFPAPTDRQEVRVLRVQQEVHPGPLNRNLISNGTGKMCASRAWALSAHWTSSLEHRSPLAPTTPAVLMPTRRSARLMDLKAQPGPSRAEAVPTPLPTLPALPTSPSTTRDLTTTT